MRLLFVVTLTFTAFLTAANASALNNAPLNRLLRSAASVNEEERGLFQKISSTASKLVMPNKAAIKSMDTELAKATGTSMYQTFKAVDPKNFNSVDDLFRSKAFHTFESYVFRFNQQDITKQTNVVRIFRIGFGVKKTMKLFIKAGESSDETVRASGKFFQRQLLRQLTNEGRSWTEIRYVIPKKYSAYFLEEFQNLLVESSKARRNELLKL